MNCVYFRFFFLKYFKWILSVWFFFSFFCSGILILFVDLCVFLVFGLIFGFVLWKFGTRYFRPFGCHNPPWFLFLLFSQFETRYLLYWLYFQFSTLVVFHFLIGCLFNYLIGFLLCFLIVCHIGLLIAWMFLLLVSLYYWVAKTLQLYS